ncbi:MAG: hypothetical protein JRN27_01025 [Nitrososphaerota archaeon]|nr:hypothetical protein [Nitrososphaerota archaeon]MDG6974664.1 hypothetical protein [Nitrososphaerota archaeon]
MKTACHSELSERSRKGLAILPRSWRYARKYIAPRYGSGVLRKSQPESVNEGVEARC